MFSFKRKIKNFVKRCESFIKAKQVVKTSLLTIGLLSITNMASAFSANVQIPANLNGNDAVIHVQPEFEMKYLSYGSYELECTAYSPDEGWSITASGIPLTECIGWGCASNDFPLGSWIHIECPSAPWIDGDYQIVDRMAYSGCIDLAMGSIDECYSFGRRTIYVTQL